MRPHGLISERDNDFPWFDFDTFRQLFRQRLTFATVFAQYIRRMRIKIITQGLIQVRRQRLQYRLHFLWRYRGVNNLHLL